MKIVPHRHSDYAQLGLHSTTAFAALAVKNDGMKKVITECRRGLRSAVSGYTMKDSAGGYERSVLITRPAARSEGGGKGRKARRIHDDCAVFAPNLPTGRERRGMLMLPEGCHRRLGIEIAYRQMEEFRSWRRATASRSA